jgi:hypothetical protein
VIGETGKTRPSIADMLPVTSTFTGHLATAEAIDDGPHDNLAGIETFSGSDDKQVLRQVQTANKT